MSTKIFYNDNRIIIDGHADTEQECQAITAMCDSLANDTNFKTIIYEKGHAVFEKINGGDTMMFESLQTQLNELSAYVKTIKSCKCDLEKALADYLTQDEASKTYETIEAHLASIQLLQNAIDIINNTLGNVDTTKGTVAEQLNNMNVLILQVQNTANEAFSLAEVANSNISALEARIVALENKETKALPFTIDELIAKLESI